MPTIGQVYNPIIEARRDPVAFERLLREAGTAIFKANPGRCPNEQDGHEAAKRNLNYYCQYFDSTIAAEVKAALGAGDSWVSLGGHEVPGAYRKEAA